MKTLDYDKDMRSMGAILHEEGAVEFYRARRVRLAEDKGHLEADLTAGRTDEMVLDCGTVRIRYRGADEAGHLYAALAAI